MAGSSSAPAARPTETRWDPAGYERTARFVSDFGMPVVALLAPRAGERILDLGCGDGALTVKLRDMGVDIVGADPSAEFVAAARGLGLDARLMSGEELTFQNEFDAVFSNAALHWVKDHDAMLANVARALKPGGRFVAEFGGARNVATITNALMVALGRRGIDGSALNPWHFPTPEVYRARLERHGFAVNEIHHFDRPTPLPGALADWLETFAQSFLAPLSGRERDDVKRETEEMLADVLMGPNGWVADYVRIRFKATKTA